MNTPKLQINPDRFKATFDTLAQIGATNNGGVHRPTFSPAHLQARKWFREQIIRSGLEFRLDSAGNHSAFLACGSDRAPTLLLGSHLDSVPNGGRFDGALGVVAALEVLCCIQEAGISLPFNLEAIDFTDEEGTLVGLLGSSAVAGKLSAVDLLEPRGGRANLLEGLHQANLAEAGLLECERTPESLAGYLELHIEQGARLWEAKVSIGIVTSIVGIGSYRLTFMGIANHAGTTTMQSRRDAALGASAFTLGARQLVLKQFPECVANVGDMSFEPGAFNIIPGRVSISLEYRAPESKNFVALENALLELAQQQAQAFDLGLEIECLGKHIPAPMNANMQIAIAHAAQILQLESIYLASGAGHDAQSLAEICPVGMIFVPSKEGISHSAFEFSTWTDCLNGANLLLQTTLSLAEQLPPSL